MKADLPLDSEIRIKINTNYAVKCLIILHSDEIVLGMDYQARCVYCNGHEILSLPRFPVGRQLSVFLFLKLRRWHFWVHLGSKSYMI